MQRKKNRFSSQGSKVVFIHILDSKIGIGELKNRNVSCNCATFYGTFSFYDYFTGIRTKKRMLHGIV